MVHLTETCDADRPRLITHVATTLAPVADHDALGSIQADLAAHDLLPDTHLVDPGYVGADLLLASTRDHTVTLLGPSPQDTRWTGLNIGRIVGWLAGETLHRPADHPSLASSAKPPEPLHSPAV